MTIVPVLLLVFLLCVGEVSPAKGNEEYHRCNIALESWSDQALYELAQVSETDTLKLKELLFFIHVPRTGGRTYHQCLLRHLYPPEQQCDRSYDQLRFNASKHCRLLVTHNDYSILAKLPPETTSVITNLRHPVDRVFSAYEFSVEVAARFLAKNLQKFSVSRNSKKTSGPSTLNIWPWRYLVPWMREDLFSRRAARQSDGDTSPLQNFTHYNASSYVMPLHEFIHHPLVMDLLQNGATLQLAGLTNNSYTEGAADLRKCISNYPDLGHIVLNVAKRRIDKMIFVGLTDKHKDSATLFAHVVGGQILPRGQASNNSSLETNLGMVSHPTTFKDSNITNSQPSKQASGSNKNAGAARLTVYGLIEKYQSCSGSLRSTQIQRRILSMKNVLPVNFSNEARGEVAEATMEAIRQLNSLDLELYTYAKHRFSMQLSRHGDSKAVGWEPNRALPQHTQAQRLYDWYSPSSGLRKLMNLMLLTMASGVATIGVCLFVLLNGSRIMRLQTGSNHAALKKI